MRSCIFQTAAQDSDLVVPANQSAFAKRTQRAKAKTGGMPPLPETFAEVVDLLQDGLKVTPVGDPFFAYSGTVLDNVGDENDEPQTMVVFVSPFGRDLLTSSKIWLSNGTFKSAPLPFHHIYVVFGQLPSDKVLPTVFGSLFCLVSKRMSIAVCGL